MSDRVTSQEELEDVLSAVEAADIMGVRTVSVTRAILRGAISPAKRVGGDRRGLWITTRAAVARFQARKDALGVMGKGQPRKRP